MLNSILATAIVAGALAGVFVFGAHMVKVVPLIKAAEVYENAEATPRPVSGPAVSGPAVSGQAHGARYAEAHAKAIPAAAHSHDEEAWAPENGMERSLYTLLADLIMGVGFGLMLTAIIAISNREVDWQKGILWGLAGFCAVTAFPALGLAPEMPGMQAAALAERHIWWGATVAASSIGLGLMFLTQSWALRIGGVILLTIPHIIGAPHVKLEAGLIPVEMGSQYAATTLIITLFFWVVLGGLAGHFYQRFARD
jgi:cobalt transporter subunit CbtA